MKFKRTLLLAVGAVVFNGCASGLMYSLPKNLGNNGMVVANVRTEDFPIIFRGSPTIDGKTYFGGFNEGYITVPLSPGQHTLTSLDVPDGGNMYMQSQLIYHVNISFTVEPGKVTNLGLIRINRDEQRQNGAQSGPLSVSLFDNTADMVDVIAASNPDLYGNLRDKAFVLAPAAFKDAKTLQSLRYEMALNKVTSSWRERNPKAQFVMGPYGTLARVQKDAKGSMKLQVIDAQTTRDLSGCSSVGERASCMVSSTKYFMVRGDKVEFRAVPDGIAANSIHALDANKLLIVDESMNLHLSVDEGKSWQKQTDFPATKFIVHDLYRPDILNSVGLEAGIDGHYLYTRGQRKDPGTRVLYAKHGSGTYAEVSLPKNPLWLHSLEENGSGLYITHGTSGWTVIGTQVLFRPAGATEWRIGNLPVMRCLELTLNDSEPLHAKINCEDGATWLSKDGGSTWVERALPR